MNYRRKCTKIKLPSEAKKRKKKNPHIYSFSEGQKVNNIYICGM